MKISSILVFSNGNIAVFDENDEQVSELQKFTIQDLIRDKAIDNGYNADKARIKFQWDVTN